MANPQMVMYEEEFNQIQAIVDRLVKEANAQVVFIIDKSGEINIRAESGPAVVSSILTFEIPPEIITVTPSPATETTTPSPTATATPTDTPTATPLATPLPVNQTDQGGINFGDWLVALIVTAIISGANYWVVNIKSGLRWGVRAALLPVIGGMFTYTYAAISLPGSAAMLEKMGTWGILLIVIIGAGLGAGAVWLWQMLETRKIRPAQN